MELILMQLFHGSNVIVREPKILVNGFYKDFGYGFYCTKLEKQAKRWALTKRNNHVVNIYEYEDHISLNKELDICRFDTMTDEWLEFVVSCRRGVEHKYDVVEGPMADDTIWDYIEDYVSGMISKEAFWVLVKFKYPTHQLVFCTERSLELLKYEGSYHL